MITDIRENNLTNYVNKFIANPERFAKPLSNDEVKEYGVRNSDFWKSFIVNINTLKSDKQLKDEGFYVNLARIYFVKRENEKFYLIEKLPPTLKPIDKNKVSEVAAELKKQGIIVDEKSAVLIDKEKQIYKFSKYEIEG